VKDEDLALIDTYVDLVPPYRLLQLGSKIWSDYCQPYVEKGCDVMAIDLDGRQNARRIDLCKPIPVEMVGGRFDLITNFGDTEHVENQAQCWNSIHSLLNVGGFIVSSTPRPGHWRKHGIWYVDEPWVREFSELNGYEVRHLGGETLVNYVLKKREDPPFRMPATKIHVEKPGATKLTHPRLYNLAENK